MTGAAGTMYKAYSAPATSTKSVRRKRYRKPRKLAQRVKMLEKKVAHNDPEDKYHNRRVNVGATSAGSLTELADIPQGDEDIQRNGDSVFLKLLHLNMVMFNRSANAAEEQYVRVIIIQDKDNSIINVSDFWSAEYLGVANAPLGFKNHDKRFQSRVLYDQLIAMPAVGGGSIQKRQVKVPLKFHTQYESASTTITTGSLKVFIIGDDAADPSNPNVDFTSRIYYEDP